ncbi:RluA family pseudouridine synthase [Chengkuizengella axinellae]|uniref:Pseudouridine synthase n=1 Tax=Chengkuizengella axinellae TaxID=3064388 RepID=A0ABT9IUY4_9BACL|nr:RluA family pseudouridine synthase [Chengkuizengella sp. 2205SS18-9]MDP5273175.1 RluA family pseudouridine synthase [Chengkuizengella sp. 2205SS18-9]
MLFEDIYENELVWEGTSELEGTRIDKFLSDQFEGISRTQIQQWIKDGHVSVNSHSVKVNYKVQGKDQIKLLAPSPTELEIKAESIPLDVVYEDKHLIVVNKSRGMVVHPAPGNYSGTLVNALLAHCKDLSGINGVLRPGIVHRIDKNTSGLLVSAKDDATHAGLSEQLKDHTVHRKYIAVVHGKLSHLQGTVDAPIGRDPKDRKCYTVTNKNSKRAVTHFVVLEQFKNYALIELRLETGRTHQIRVHMKFIGHHIVGDPTYGRNKGISMEGQALHAAELGFVHPITGEQLMFTAPIPEDMSNVLDKVKSQ